jgi:hypothetical protein
MKQKYAEIFEDVLLNICLYKSVARNGGRGPLGLFGACGAPGPFDCCHCLRDIIFILKIYGMFWKIP